MEFKTLRELLGDHFVARRNDEIAGEREVVEKNGATGGAGIGVFVDLLPTERKQGLE